MPKYSWRPVREALSKLRRGQRVQIGGMEGVTQEVWLRRINARIWGWKQKGQIGGKFTLASAGDKTSVIVKRLEL